MTTSTPTRTVRLKGTAVELTIGRSRTVYRLRRSGRGWALTKDTGPTYRVHLGGARTTCTCLGHHYRGHCKHAAALLALALHGAIGEATR